MVVMLEIPQELAQAVTNYLSTKPFREVSGLIQEMVMLKPAKEPDPPPDPPKA